jgi:hypothetical protein
MAPVPVTPPAVLPVAPPSASVTPATKKCKKGRKLNKKTGKCVKKKRK